jgi:hypothetical protein
MPQINKENQKMSTCNQLHLGETMILIDCAKNSAWDMIDGHLRSMA